jgi:thiol-disulfide isomerase/thioredoxin
MSIRSRSGRAFASVLSLCGGTLVAQQPLAAGAVAPDLTFDAVLNGPAPVHSLADLRGSAVLMEFWATWCGPCRAQMPHMKQLHSNYADRGLVVLGMNFNEKRGQVEAFVKQNEMEYLIGLDGGAAGRKYGVAGIPHAFLIDPAGVIVWAGHPASLADADVERALAGAHPFGLKLGDQLEPVQMMLDKGSKGRALQLLGVLQKGGKLEPKAQELAAATVKRLVGETERTAARAELLLKQGDRVGAAWLWQGLVEQFDGHDSAKAAAAHLEQLGSDDDGKRALALLHRLMAARDLAAKKQFDDAAAEYERALKADDAGASELAKHGLAAIEAQRQAASK